MANRFITDQPNGEIYCAFCKKNGELEAFYRTHKLKDENDLITCPVLKQYECPKCGVVGQHTASYCPKNGARDRREARRLNAPTKSASILLSGPIFGLEASKKLPQVHPKQPVVRKALNAVPSEHLAASTKLSPEHPTKVLKRYDVFKPFNTIELPPFNRPGGCLTEKVLEQLLYFANTLPASSRCSLFMNLDYNPARFELVRQAAYIADYVIMKEIFQSR